MMLVSIGKTRWFLCIIGQSIQNQEKNLPPFLPPHHKGGKGEDAPFKNCAKKRRVGRNSAHLFSLYCTEVTSLCAPLEIGGHTDRDGENQPAPVAVKIEGAGQGKKGETAPAVNTPAPVQTEGSFRRRLLQMRATVVVQDRTVWLSGGGTHLCVLSVSGAVR